MGQYRIEITAVGGHGCEKRERGDADRVYGCRRMNCPDCRAREFVALLKHMGQQIQSAIIVHWPDRPGTVADDLLSGERFGRFPEYRDRDGRPVPPVKVHVTLDPIFPSHGEGDRKHNLHRKKD